MPLHQKQIALVHVAKKQLGLDEDSYRDILRRHGGAESSADLDAAGFQGVMARLTALGFRSTWVKRTFGNRAGMASPAQVRYIRDLWAKIAPDDKKEAGLNAWLTKYHGVSALRFIDAETVQKVLPGLKNMAARADQGGPSPETRP